MTPGPPSLGIGCKITACPATSLHFLAILIRTLRGDNLRVSIAGIDQHSTAGAFSKHDPKPQKLLEKILLVTRFHCAPACRHFCHLLLFFW